MPIVAVVNQKGGVGKTTVALGLAASASHRGLRVLVVDLDPQANATSGLGVWDAPTTVDTALASDEPGSAARLAVALRVADGPRGRTRCRRPLGRRQHPRPRRP